MKKKKISDEEIVKRFFSKERSHKDCVTFIERFSPRIKKQIRDLITRRYEMEDFFHDVVVHLLSIKPSNYTEEGSFDAWLFQIVRNLYISKIKKERRVMYVLKHKLNSSSNDSLKREKLRELVREKMKELTELQRCTIKMVFFEKLSQKEICKREGIGLNTHNKRLSRAKKNLGNCWSKAESLKFSKIDGLAIA